jgi:putative PIN family toxin of toxin-antitoxin system
MLKKTKVVIDTTIVLQAALNPSGFSGMILTLIENGTIELLTSSKLSEEYHDILFRPSVRKPNARLTDDIARELLGKIAIVATHFDFIPSFVHYERDPNDEPSLNLSVATKADFLIAWDRDLRDLADERDFNLLYPFLKIVSPEEFIQGQVAQTPPNPM